MAFTRRNFLKGIGVAAASAALSPRIKRAAAASGNQHVVIVGIGGGLRRRESLGMAEGATMPNLFGTTRLVTNYGSGAPGAPRIAPEYAAIAPQLALPAPRTTPLHTLGTLV